jgi:hypothetical protein
MMGKGYFKLDSHETDSFPGMACSQQHLQAHAVCRNLTCNALYLRSLISL